MITALVVTAMMGASNVSIAKDGNPEPTSQQATADFCTVKGLFYTVQIGVFSQPINEDLLPDVAKPLYCLKREDGNYAYFSGIFDSRFEAMRKRYHIVSKGQYDAYVAVYYNGQQINMADADELLAAHGDDILYNAEQQEDYTQNQSK